MKRRSSQYSLKGEVHQVAPASLGLVMHGCLNLGWEMTTLLFVLLKSLGDKTYHYLAMYSRSSPFIYTYTYNSTDQDIGMLKDTFYYTFEGYEHFDL